MADDSRSPFVVLPGGGDVNLPTVDDHADDQVQVWLNPEDSVVYRREYLDEIYVDRHITNFAIQPEVATLNVDDQMLTLYYESGEQYQLLLGSIVEVGPSASKYYQILSQLIVAADADLTPLFNYQTTPNLLDLRRALNQLMRELNDQRIAIGSIVYSFAKMIDALHSRNMSEVLKELAQQQ